MAEPDLEGAAQRESIADLLGEVVGDAQHLVRSEIALARQEVREELGELREGLTALAAGGGVLAVGALLLALMLVHLLADVAGLALWLSFLVVGGLLVLAGYLLVQQAQSKMARVDPVPRAAIESVRKDMEWIRQQSPSDGTSSRPAST
jgi:hypothetical protein